MKLGIHIDNNKITIYRNNKIIYEDINFSITNKITNRIEKIGTKAKKVYEIKTDKYEINTNIEEVIKYILERKLILYLFFNTKVLVTTPTKVDKEKINTKLKKLISRNIYFEEDNKVVAFGGKINISSIEPTMVININKSLIKIDVFSLGKAIKEEIIPIKNENFDSIKDNLQKKINKILEDKQINNLKEIRNKGINVIGDDEKIEELNNFLSKELKLPVLITSNYYNNVNKGLFFMLNNKFLLNK